MKPPWWVHVVRAAVFYLVLMAAIYAVAELGPEIFQ